MSKALHPFRRTKLSTRPKNSLASLGGTAGAFVSAFVLDSKLWSVVRVALEPEKRQSQGVRLVIFLSTRMVLVTNCLTNMAKPVLQLIFKPSLHIAVSIHLTNRFRLIPCFDLYELDVLIQGLGLREPRPKKPMKPQPIVQSPIIEKADLRTSW